MANEPRMTVLTQDQTETLDKMVKTMDPALSITDIDYGAGTISVGITYNRGTKDEWTNKDFIVVNVACDSVSAIFWDVHKAVHERCD